MGVEGRKYAQTWAGVRCGGRGRMGVEGRKYAQTWAGERCGGGVRMGVEGRKYAQPWAGCGAMGVYVGEWVGANAH